LPVGTVEDGGQSDDGNKVEPTTLVKKILPGTIIKLVGTDDDSDIAPVATSGVDDRGDGVDISSLDKVETKNVVIGSKAIGNRKEMTKNKQ